MKRLYGLIALLMFSASMLEAQSSHIGEGLASIAAIVGETKTPEDSVATEPEKLRSDEAVAEASRQRVVSSRKGSEDSVKVVLPVWKQKLYYGYNFDIYFHHDSRSDRKENGFSIAITPEIGWRLKEKLYIGLRFGGSYQNLKTTFTHDMGNGTTQSVDVRVQEGAWEVAPYMRYRLKTLFNDKVGIWLETHLYTNMSFPRVADVDLPNIKGTDYDGLRYSVTYGFQVAPVITYQFNRKSTFQVFFSILSIGYSGTAFFIKDETGVGHTEYTNDVIIFSGKLRNLLANQFTPGLYGLKFGVQKSF